MWLFAGTRQAGTGWEIGEIPDEYKNAEANIYPLTPVPTLTHSWTSSSSGFYLNLQVTVTNLGSAPEKDVSVFTGFDAGNDMV